MRDSDAEMLDLVYATAFDPEQWTGVLERVADRVGGTSGWLSQLDMIDGSGGSAADPMARVDPEWPRRYIAHFATRNPLSNVADVQSYLKAWRPLVLTDEDWMPKSDLIRSEFYNDFLRPQGLHSSMMIRLGAKGAEVATLNVGRPQGRGQFDKDELDFARWLQPHLIRALSLGGRAAHRVNAEFELLMDASASALILLDLAGRVRHANAAARRLIGPLGPLRMIDGRLVAVSRAQSAGLDAMIGLAASADVERRAGGNLALTAADGANRYVATAAPLRPPGVLIGRPAVLLSITDLDGPVALDEGKLKAMFNLTAAEIRVAQALAEGIGAREAAKRFGVSPHTVNNQLVRIFEKTGVKRQSELVRLLTRLAADPLGPRH